MCSRQNNPVLWTLCGLLMLAIVALGIFIAVIALNFKLPTTNFSSIRNTEEKTIFDNGIISSSLIADVVIENHNFFDIYLQNVDITLELELIPGKTVAKGNLSNKNIPKDVPTPIAVPISISLDTKTLNSTAVIDLLHQCVANVLKFQGFFSVKPMIFGIGMPTLPSFQRKVTTPCPFQDSLTSLVNSTK